MQYGWSGTLGKRQLEQIHRSFWVGVGVGVAALMAFRCSSSSVWMYVLRCEVSCCVGEGVGAEVGVVVLFEGVMCWSAMRA